MDAFPIRLDFVRSDLDAAGQRRRPWCRIVARRLARGLRVSEAADVLAAGALAAALVEQEPDGLAASRRAVALLDAALIAPDTPLDPGARAILEDAAEDLLGARAETAPSTVAPPSRRGAPQRGRAWSVQYAGPVAGGGGAGVRRRAPRLGRTTP
jgi:hypothetical protein